MLSLLFLLAVSGAIGQKCIRRERSQTQTQSPPPSATEPISQNPSSGRTPLPSGVTTKSIRDAMPPPEPKEIPNGYAALTPYAYKHPESIYDDDSQVGWTEAYSKLPFQREANVKKCVLGGYQPLTQPLYKSISLRPYQILKEDTKNLQQQRGNLKF